MSALPPKVDKEQTSRNVRFVPKADLCNAANSSWAQCRELLATSPALYDASLGDVGVTQAQVDGKSPACLSGSASKRLISRIELNL